MIEPISETRHFYWTNLKNILLLTDKMTVDQLNPSIVKNIKYYEVEKKDEWRIGMVKEILDVKYGNFLLPADGWSEEDLDMMLNTGCTH